jgi:hypothetical protein
MKFHVLVIGLLLVACVESRDHGAGKSIENQDGGAGACQDSDGDGYGEGCERGGDCNDSDETIHTGCSQCVTPQQGCICAEAAKPVSCYLSPTADDSGTVMCHEGTRYCREGHWSACESIVTYPKPESTQPQAIVAADAGPARCNECNVNCFIVRDSLDPVDAGLDSSTTNTQLTDGGGLTLTYAVVDSGIPMDASTFDPSTCILGTAPDHDCDGIPDIYDPYPNQKPFATANPTIFLDVAPGETGVGVVKLAFYLNSADIYFLVDQTGSMVGERDRLVADMVSGDFINNPAFNCADYDFDFHPNNELKTQGLVGAIRCIIRDANFGVGYFREIPFENSGGSYYAAKDSITYRNLQDITSNIASMSTAVSKLTPILNIDWPEASMVALNSVVTGNGMYVGVDRPGLPPRAGCPSLAWGYPCFRSNAIPIVVMFTDAPFHNGPATGTAPAIANDPYKAATLGMTAGTTTSYTSVAPTNENTANAYDLGDLTNSYNSYIGSTTGMASDLGHSAVTCGSSTFPSAPDALFKFTLSATKSVKLTTEGSDFDTTLSLYRGKPGTAMILGGATTNDTTAMPYSFGDAANNFKKTSGNSGTHLSDYSASDVSCSAAAGAKDSTFTFGLTQATRVALDTAGSGYGTVLGLFSGPPTGTTSYTAVANNDTVASPYTVTGGALNGRNLGFSGTTSAANIFANYTATQLSCASPPADASPDAVYSFTLSSPTRVRVSSEESTLPTVLALVDNGTFVSPTAVTGNEAEVNAYNVAGLDGNAYQYTQSTAAMAADYNNAVVSCNAGDTAKDAVYKFTLAATRNVQIDTLGSSLDTVLGLFRGTVTPANTNVALGSNAHETATLANSIGTVNGKRYVITGGSTNSMLADYTGTQIGCGANSASPDAVFKFHLNTGTNVLIDTNGSSFDTVASLHSAALPDLVIAAVSNANEAVGTAYPIPVATSTSASNLRFDGTTALMAVNVPVNDGLGCSANVGAADAVFQLTVATPGNYRIDTIGSGFDTVLGLYPSTVYNPAPPTPVAEGSSGELKSSAVIVGALDGKWLSYTGSTSSMANNSTAANNTTMTACSVTTNSKDAFYSFTLPGPRTVSIDTIGSSFDTVIGLFNSADVAQSPACDNDGGGGTASKITANLPGGSYYVIIKGRGGSTSGNYAITFRDTAVSTTTNLLACDNDGGGGTASQITRNLAAGTYYVVVKGNAAGNKGAYKLSVKQTDWYDAANRLACDNDGGTATASLIQQNLAAGDYWVVVKGLASGNKGTYTLTVQDSNLVACNDNSTGTTSLISQSLTAGTYYVVVKGTGTASGSYVLNMRDTSVSLVNSLACDYNSGPGGRSLIEQNLAAGTYRVIVKGKAAADKGAYKLILRDLTALPTQLIACDHNSGSGGKSYLEADLAIGTYTVVMKGDTLAGAGAYSLSVRDASNMAASDAPLDCNNDIDAATDTSSVTQTLTPGTYYAAVKGYSTANSGTYQLSLGGGSTIGATYAPPTYAQTLAALNAKQVRVMSVLSCHDDPIYGDKNWLGSPGPCITTRTQATALANATGALGSNLAPLVFDIDGNGSGLSKTVVDGVAALAHYLEMNVFARVVFNPDANPGFGLLVRAVDAPGDGCSGLVGIEHQHCVPGASPRFELEFTNPLGSPIALNPNDPNGGYNFRAELIGDNQFVVDRVPIYIIPRDVNNVPEPIAQVVPQGSYWQDVAAPGCSQTQRPDWHDLTWSADVPQGTSVSFNVCASDKATDLQTCPLTTLCTITGGAACTADSECGYGKCFKKSGAMTGNCQTVTANACATDAQCLSGSHCRASKCTFDVQPVYIGDVLGSKNYAANLRMNVALTGNTTANTAPIVHDWSLTYVCSSVL